MKKKYILIFLMILILAPALSVGASSATRQRHRELERRLQDVRQDVRNQQNLLAGTRHEMSQVVAEMQELDQKMQDANEALAGIELSLLDTVIKIEDAEEARNAAQEEYDLQFEVFKARLRVMHEQGAIGFLDVLFQAGSLSDFLMRLEHIRTVAEFDRSLLSRLETAENNIATLIEDLSRWYSMEENLQFQYNRVLRDLEFTMEQRAEWFERLSEDEEMRAELLAISEQELIMAQSSFEQINSQLRREQNELARQQAAAAHTANLAALNNFDGSFQWPIPTHSRVSSGFGMRMHPILRVNRHHNGIDVPAPTGTRLIAAADGYVRFAGWSSGYGNTVIIDHGNNYSTLYAHNSRNRVTTGQFVSRGAHIADVGSTGMSTGPHLHFEIRVNNVHKNPMDYWSTR